MEFIWNDICKVNVKVCIWVDSRILDSLFIKMAMNLKHERVVVWGYELVPTDASDCVGRPGIIGNYPRKRVKAGCSCRPREKGRGAVLPP